MSADVDKREKETVLESLALLHDQKRLFQPCLERSDSLWASPSYFARSVPDFEELEPLNPKGVYTLLAIVPNEDAIRLIERESRRLSRIRYGGNDDLSVHFGHSLSESYISFIERALKKRRTKHLSYPLVDGERDYSFLTRRYPHVFLLAGNKPLDEMFDGIIASFNKPKVHEAMKKREAPQNYELAPIVTLYEAGILPFVRSRDISAHISGTELKLFVDLMLPWKMEEPHDCSRTIDAD